MRTLTVLSFLLFSSIVAFSQATVVGGVAANYGYGPFVPLVTTPSVALQDASPNAAGASNATQGLSAGASNSTLSMPPANATSGFSQAVWYGGGEVPLTSPTISLRPVAVAPASPNEEVHQDLLGWDLLGAPARNSLVQASAYAKTAQHATRTYTNDDINRLKDMPLSGK